MTRRRNPDALGSGHPWPPELEGRRPLGLQGKDGYFGFESMKGRGASSEVSVGKASGLARWRASGARGKLVP
jgi:hypothetical protein